MSQKKYEQKIKIKINMNHNIYESNRGRNIQPSARASIHNNCVDCRNFKTMGKYGIENRRRELNLPAQGVDDVDNVMSKMYSSKDPIPIPHHKILRRHSYGISDDNDDDDDESDENILSKSSPPSFPSSSEAFTASESMLERNLHDHSTSNNSSRLEEKYYETLHNSSSQNRRTESNNSCSNLIFILLSILICGLGVIYYKYLENESQEIDVYDKLSFYNDVKYIGKKYKLQDNSILKVKTGISTIFENQDTGSFIFTYDSNANNFNPLKVDQFFEDISAKSSKYLRNETKQVHPVVVNLSKQMVRTEKDFMNQYQSEVDKWGVMLVKDVDNIPSHLAMAFHYYCDEYNPLVKKSAIFFTLNLANCSNGSERKSTHGYIEKCLARKWNSVEQDKIGPLLTRVVNVVIDVTGIY